jgi:hypothetical protein
VRAPGPEPVVLVLPERAALGGGGRRQVESGEGGAEIQPRAADDERHVAVVDRCVREPLVLTDGDVRAERQDPDEPGRVVGHGGDDRQTVVERSRVRGHDLGPEPLTKDPGDRGLPGCGRAEEREDVAA